MKTVKKGLDKEGDVSKENITRKKKIKISWTAKYFLRDRPKNGVIFIPKLFQTLKSAWRTSDNMT